MPRPAVRLIAAALVALVLALPLTAAAGRPTACAASHWVGAWEAAPSNPGPPYADQTLRLIVNPHLGGSVARLRLSNRFGSAPLRIERVGIGLRASGARLVAGSNRVVTFGRRRSLSIPVGADAISDAVRLKVEAFRDLAVSIYVRRPTGPTTAHALALQDSYVATGDHVGDVSGAAFPDPTLISWPLLDGVDVRAPERTGAVVAFGDSLTDGVAATGGNRRYPDFLARRLLARGPRMSVLNAGISGDHIFHGAPTPRSGPRGLLRLGRDVPADAGVSDVIVLEGINDIAASTSVAQVIAGLRQIGAQLHRRHLHVLVGTLTPSGGYPSPAWGGAHADATRRAVNRWIRQSHVPDAVVDFDAALRDPREPSRLRRRYDSGDHLHPNAAGYRRMADAVDLARLIGPACTRR